MVFKFKAGFVHPLQQYFCWKSISILMVVLALQGCVGTISPQNITCIFFSDLSNRPDVRCDGLDVSEHKLCTAELQASLRFAEIGKEIMIFPDGQGTCKQATVDFGDGTPPSVFTNQTVDHNLTWKITHTYNGWPGKKLVRVKGELGCLGDVSKEISVGIGAKGREDFNLGLCFGPCVAPTPATMVCNVVTPPMPPIRKGSGVRIETDGKKIDYGSSHIFDAGGDPASPTSPRGYLFQQRRKFSLVYRIGGQDIQGEAGKVVFIANNTAPLEVCTNDNPAYLADNIGGMLLTITVNERSAE